MFVAGNAATGGGRRVPRPLTTFDGRPVDALYFRSQRGLLDERARLHESGEVTYESDVKPSDRYVMERFVTGGLHIEGRAEKRRGVIHFDNPRIRATDAPASLRLLALDIETDGFAGPLLSAALTTPNHERVLVRGRPSPGFRDEGAGVIAFAADERALLLALFAHIVELDPDVICGWNITEFDLTVLDARARAFDVPFAIGRSGERARMLPAQHASARRARPCSRSCGARWHRDPQVRHVLVRALHPGIRGPAAPRAWKKDHQVDRPDRRDTPHACGRYVRARCLQPRGLSPRPRYLRRR